MIHSAASKKNNLMATLLAYSLEERSRSDSQKCFIERSWSLWILLQASKFCLRCFLQGQEKYMSDMQFQSESVGGRRAFLRNVLATGVGLAALSSSGSSVKNERTPEPAPEELEGIAQSPIALNHSTCFRQQHSHAIAIDYDRPILAIERGEHGVKLIPAAGNGIVLHGERYELQQIHFHTPSEHMIDGKLAAGEIHFVNKNARGELAVLGVLLKEGKNNSCFEAVFEALPEEAGKTALCQRRCNPSAMLPANRNAFVYEGSLTTPPYTEGVHWMVMEQAVEMEGPIKRGDTQLGCLAKILGDNHREVQAPNGRPVTLTNLAR
jgi:carbonic anhydrase